MLTRRIRSAAVASIVLMLAGPVAATDPESAPISAEAQFAIDRNTEMAIAAFSKLAKIEFDYSEESIEWIDGFIERNRTADPEKMADVIGSYLGNAIVKNFGGRWVSVRDTVGVELEGDVVTFPMAKVEKQFVNGAEDSILAFYRVIPVLVRDQKEKKSSSPNDRPAR
jgi:hypothetical protein